VKAKSVMDKLADKEVLNAYKKMGRCIEFPAYGGKVPPIMQSMSPAQIQQATNSQKSSTLWFSVGDILVHSLIQQATNSQRSSI